MENQPALLNSWKEISNYIGRGVRTVQRWERDFGLPVRRPAGHLKSSVIALSGDIDQWLAGRRSRLQEAAPQAVFSHKDREALHTTADLRLRTNLTLLKANLERLQSERMRLLATGKETQELRRRMNTRTASNGAA